MRRFRNLVIECQKDIKIYRVNIDKIEEIRTTESGGHEIHLRSGKTVPLSRGYREEFRSLFRD